MKRKAKVDERIGLAEQRRNVAGIDLAGHADHYVCGPRLDGGTPNVRHFGTTTSELERMACWLAEQNVVSVAMESTSVYWIPVCDLLESRGFEVVLVDTREVRMVPGRKSDVQDCQWLQKLHSCGLLRGCFRPAEDICAVRSLIREKAAVTAERSDWIRRMQKSCDQMNIRIHHAVSDIDGATGMAILRAIAEGERDPHRLAGLRDRRCRKSEAEIAECLRGNWREEHVFSLTQALMTCEFMNARIADYDRKILSMAQRLARPDAASVPEHPDGCKSGQMRRLGEDPMRQALYSMSGVDLTRISGIRADTAAILLGELGTDLSRFPTERHLISYLGLAPKKATSAGKPVRGLKRHKCTARAGAALRMAAATLRRSDCELGAYYRSVAKRSDAARAVKATARRMCARVYRMMRYGQDYADRGASAYEQRFRDRKIKAVKRMLNGLDLTDSERAQLLTSV